MEIINSFKLLVKSVISKKSKISLRHDKLTMCLQLFSAHLATLGIFPPPTWTSQANTLAWVPYRTAPSGFSLSSGWHLLQTAWPEAGKAGPNGSGHVYHSIGTEQHGWPWLTQSIRISEKTWEWEEMPQTLGSGFTRHMTS